MLIRNKTMKYPPGFTPKEGSEEIGMYAEESKSVNFVNLSDHKAEEANKVVMVICVNQNSRKCIKFGQVMGYKMDGCMSNMTEIIESPEGERGESMNFMSLNIQGLAQKAKKDRVKELCVNTQKGEVVIMGDFNEVRYKSDRFGSVFNVSRLLGVQFVHQLNAEFGKERYLSDHRPILLREASFDYGPTPFRYFHYWNEMEGFNKVVEDAWREGPCDKTNAILKAKYKEELEALEAIIDRGDGNEEIVNKRTEVVNNIQKFDKIHSSEMAQKAKNELESEVSNVEIKRAVWDCGTDKSPGPDGFTFGFYRRFWKIIKNDVYDADIVNEVQSAFIAERQILDGPFILNEILQWSKTKKKQSLIFKVDFEKAYDSVRWDFLDDILKKFGFGEKWCKWIQSCLRSSRGSILINGSPTEEFQFYKGLKQGDSLSPLLFILIMESLHLSFQRVVDNGMFNGIKLSSSLSISHLFYADDAVFMGQWCDGNISTLIHVLECFYRASGLRINMSKSKILGVNVDSDKVKGAASKLGCLILKPFKNPRGGVEQDQFNELSALVHDVSLIPMFDRWKWDLESSGDFSVASVRKLIDDKSFSDVDSKTQWIKYVPIKVNVHAWKVKTDSLSTRFNVSRRGIDIDSLCCAIYDNGVREYRCNASFSWYDLVKNSNLVTV
ncbi:RNA-directed DNA polymerase, eukaryota [Tanacetum coccineum]|uniref:RNA-directed DNA polymerase, eukaryota n=1 Tax=Tanacetum coccineum TaxID=301880 RepID=A0ABQ5FEV5_9ASTR